MRVSKCGIWTSHPPFVEWNDNRRVVGKGEEEHNVDANMTRTCLPFLQCRMEFVKDCVCILTSEGYSSFQLRWRTLVIFSLSGDFR